MVPSNPSLPKSILAALVVLCLGAVAAVTAAPVDAQDSVLVSARSETVASDLVEGRVLRTQSVEVVPGQPHLVSEIAVETTLKGSAAGTILVEVSGGTTNGVIVAVSTSPVLVTGDTLQLALVAAPAHEGDAILAAMSDSDADRAYSIVGGLEGTAWISGVATSQLDAMALMGAGDYSYRYPDSSGNPLKWPGFLPVPGYSINADFSGTSESSTRNAIRSGIDTWVNEPGSELAFNYLGTNSKSSTSEDRFNEIVFVATPNPADTWESSVTVYTHASIPTEIIEFDMEFNQDHSWSTYTGGTAGSYDIQTVALHSWGHVLGLEDVEPAAGEVMSAPLQTGVVRRSLGLGDTQGVQGLYPGPGSMCDGKAVTVDLGFGQVPTEGDDVIRGTAGAERIAGRGGNDTICGGGGDDAIFGDAGDDRIFAEDGNDSVWGGDGKDTIYGGNGNDTMYGEANVDVIRGGSGADFIDGADGNDRLFGGIDNDTIYGQNGNDYIGGFGGNDLIFGGFGKDLIFGGFGADTIDGGGGDDEIYGLIGNDTINGGGGNDKVRGDRGQDTVSGGAGNDLVEGGNAEDQLNGNEGDDTINGGKADDVMHGGSGTDVCTGNAHGAGDSADACETVYAVP